MRFPTSRTMNIKRCPSAFQRAGGGLKTQNGRFPSKYTLLEESLLQSFFV